MRPKSILLFERLFLASLLLGAVVFVLGYDAALATIERQEALQRLGVASTVMIASYLVGMAIYLLLWFLIARKAVGFAKWVLTFLVLVSLINLPGMVMPPYYLTKILNLAVLLLEIVAIVQLFRPDAILWFQRDAEDEMDDEAEAFD